MSQDLKTEHNLDVYKTNTYRQQQVHAYPSVRMAYLYFVPSSLSWSQATTRSRTAGNGSASSTIFCSTKQQPFQQMIKDSDLDNLSLTYLSDSC